MSRWSDDDEDGNEQAQVLTDERDVKSKSKSNYPALYGCDTDTDASAEKPISVATFHSTNLFCLVCHEELTIGGPIVHLPACSHTYHYACGETYLSRGAGRECPQCTDYEIGEQVREYPIDTWEDPKMRRFVQRTFGYVQDEDLEENEMDNDVVGDQGNVLGIEGYREFHGEKPLSFYQKTRLAKKINPLEVRKIVINRNFILEENITVDQAFGAEVDILDLYFTIGVHDWDDLIRMDLQKDHFFADETGLFAPLGQMIALYGMTWKMMRDDLSFDFEDLAKLEVAVADLRRLGADFQLFLDQGFSKGDIPYFGHFKPPHWKAFGMEKKDMYELELDQRFFRLVGWNPRLVKETFALVEHDMRKLGLALLQTERDAFVQTKKQKAVAAKRARVRAAETPETRRKPKTTGKAKAKTPVRSKPKYLDLGKLEPHRNPKL